MIHYWRAAAQWESQGLAELQKPKMMGQAPALYESFLEAMPARMLFLMVMHPTVHVTARSLQGSAYKSFVSYRPLLWAFFVYRMRAQ